MRKPSIVGLAVVAAGIAGLLITAALRETPLAFTLGVASAGPIAPLEPRQEVCQRPIDVAAGADFDRVVLQVGTYGLPGSRLRLTVKDMNGRRVANGSLPEGYADVSRQPLQRIRLDRRVSTPRVEVCIRDEGRRRVALYGNADLSARDTSAFQNGRPLGADLMLWFERQPRSLASVLPHMVERAQLFRFPWLGVWAYVVLIPALAVAAPRLLARAIAAAAEESPDAR
jgi:hypothetical protein